MTDFDHPEVPTYSTRLGAGQSFWSTVEWRLGLGLVVCVLTGAVIFVMSLFNARHPMDIPCMTIGSIVGIAGLWVIARILWAWCEWPSQYRAARWLKAIIRYFCFDATAERRDSRDHPTD